VSAFCSDCPDHEACSTGYPCWKVKELNDNSNGATKEMTDIKLWLRHPFRMLWLAQGFCPACESSPPNPKCLVCHGNYSYGRNITPGDRELWLQRFRKWLESK
jgi:hypothetical protein